MRKCKTRILEPKLYSHSAGSLRTFLRSCFVLVVSCDCGSALGAETVVGDAVSEGFDRVDWLSCVRDDRWVIDCGANAAPLAETRSSVRMENFTILFKFVVEMRFVIERWYGKNCRNAFVLTNSKLRM